MAINLEQLDKKLDQNFKRIDDRFDQLTEIMMAGFEQFDKRFQQVDAHFEKIDQKLSEHDAKFDRLFFEIKEVKIKLDQLSKRTDEDDKALFNDIDKLKKRVLFLEKEVLRLSATKQLTIWANFVKLSSSKDHWLPKRHKSRVGIQSVQS